MARHGADREFAIAGTDALEVRNPAEIDDGGRLGEPLLQHRNERLTASEIARVACLGEGVAGRRKVGRADIVECRECHVDQLPAAPRGSASAP
jgi:hypothetical protein